METYSERILFKKEDSLQERGRKTKEIKNFEYELSFLESKAKRLLKEISEKREEITSLSIPKIDFYGGRIEKNIEKVKRVRPELTSKHIVFVEEEENFAKLVDEQRKHHSVKKDSMTKYNLLVACIKAIIITGLGTGALTTFLFGINIGLIVGLVSAALNVHGVFYRNEHYLEYYNNES